VVFVEVKRQGIEERAAEVVTRLMSTVEDALLSPAKSFYSKFNIVLNQQRNFVPDFEIHFSW
jgi:hypothetical protein